MKKLFLLLLLVPCLFSRGQNLDSLFSEFVRIKGLSQEAGLPQSVKSSTPTKCAFGIISQVRLNFDKFSLKQRLMITAALQRQKTDTSIVSPAGNFRIHFYKTGSFIPQYDVNELAIAADSAYNYEINLLGYTPPPSDGTLGGDNKYDIYILNEGSDYYGGTTPESLLGDSTWTSFMEINYDYGDNFYTKGINAAKVTVAHEFHHAIQIGNYLYRSRDIFYHEITSTAMEEFVFDSINDYYGYLDAYFESPEKSFSSIDGYCLAIWNLFLANRFDKTNVAENVRGKNIIKRTWELMANHQRALPAIAQSIQEAGSSFKAEFNEFGMWTYFTNTRAVSGRYFEEAVNYPKITPFMSLPYSKATTSLDVSSEPVSNTFLVFTEGAGDIKNVLVSIISNCDISGAVSSTASLTDFTYTLAPSEFSGSRQILGGYYSQVKSSSEYVFVESNIYNGVPMNGMSIIEPDYVFPQPFKYSRHQVINIPAAATGTNKGNLFIYDINMKLIYSAEKSIVVTDKIFMQWDACDSSGRKLSTGVYLYVTKCGDNISKGKFVIYND